jgi:hypothetical protein
MIFELRGEPRKGEAYRKKVLGSGDDRGVEADGSGADGGGCGPRVGRGCGLMVLAESSYPYVTRRNDELLCKRLREKLRWGYRRSLILLDQTGEHVNHKRIYRACWEAGLMIRRKAQMAAARRVR